MNKKGKVSNGNYLWISYFDSYLNDKGRAGFVMSSQASSAGGEEAKVRKKLIEAGHVDVMMAIRPGFFYTRTVPCELWFLDKAKPGERRNKVLVIDARNIYRKVTRKIYDFTPEQQKNLSAIVWLHRGQADRFVALIAEHLGRMDEEASASTEPLDAFAKTLAGAMAKYVNGGLRSVLAATIEEIKTAEATFNDDVDGFKAKANEISHAWKSCGRDNDALKAFVERAEPLADASRDLIRQVDHLYKLLSRVVDATKKSGRGSSLKVLDEARKEAVAHLRLPRYFRQQARWLQGRFPDAELRDVEGLVKLADLKELEENDWSLTPGRHVGVAPKEEDENFNFEDALLEIHIELEGLNVEAAELAAKIARNFEELGV